MIQNMVKSNVIDNLKLFVNLMRPECYILKMLGAGVVQLINISLQAYGPEQDIQNPHKSQVGRYCQYVIPELGRQIQGILGATGLAHETCLNNKGRKVEKLSTSGLYTYGHTHFHTYMHHRCEHDTHIYACNKHTHKILLIRLSTLK